MKNRNTNKKPSDSENREHKPKCIYCESNNYKKRGFRQTENRGKIQRYFCKDCKKSFVIDDGFYRMRNSPQKITCGLDLFYRGVSTRKVQEHFKAFYPHNASNVSVYNWVIKYSKMISNFTDKIKINGGQEVQVDEMEYKTKGEKSWFIDSIDVKTRYMVASNFFKQRTTKNINVIMKKAKYKTQGNVTTITTDGFNAYIKSVKKTFGYNNKIHQFNVNHNVIIACQEGHFNIYIERLHNSIRERTKTFRGFHGSIDSADSIMKGYEIFYNFIRKHQTLGCCPFEIATDLKLENPNKWLGLIKMAKSE